MTTKYSGADWLRSAYAGIDVSPIGERVADLLGQVFRGIYHLEGNGLKKANWGCRQYIEVVIPSHQMATVDSPKLTELVVLCHDAAMRLQINGCGPKYLRLTFHQRTRVESRMEGCPTLEQHVAEIRELLCGDWIKEVSSRTP